MAGVVAALVADDDVRGLTEQVHGAAFPLVAELYAHDGDWHHRLPVPHDHTNTWR